MKNMKKLSIVALLIFVCSIFGAGCASKPAATNTAQDDSWKKVKDKGEIVVGMCAMYPPFESKNEKSGEIEGFDLDMMRAIAKELGVKVTFKDAEYVSLIGGIEKGDYDVLASGMIRENLGEGNVQGSDTYYNLNTSIVVLNENTTINKISDLEGKVVGVQTGTYAEKLVDQKTKNTKEIKRYNYSAEAFTDLKAKRIDALVVGHTFAVNEMKKKGKYIRIVDEPLGKSELIMMTKKGSNELNKKLNEGLAKVKQSGELDKIIKTWVEYK